MYPNSGEVRKDSLNEQGKKNKQMFTRLKETHALIAKRLEDKKQSEKNENFASATPNEEQENFQNSEPKFLFKPGPRSLTTSSSSR